MSILDRVRLRVAGWLLGIDPARVAQHDAMLDGVLQMSDAHIDLIKKLAGQTNRNSLALTGIFEKHRAWENADRNLLSASKRVEREQERRAKDSVGPSSPTVPDGVADATASDEAAESPIIRPSMIIIPGRAS